MKKLTVLMAVLALALLGSAPVVEALDVVGDIKQLGTGGLLWAEGTFYKVYAGPSYFGGRLGIGTYGVLDHPLTIVGSYQLGIGLEYVGTEAGGGPVIDFYNDATGAPTFDNSTKDRIATIGAVTETGGTATGRIYLQTRGSADTAPQVRMTITGAGDVGIGTLAPVAELEVVGEVVADFFTGDGHGLTDLPMPDLSGILGRLDALEGDIDGLPSGILARLDAIEAALSKPGASGDARWGK